MEDNKNTNWDGNNNNNSTWNENSENTSNTNNTSTTDTNWNKNTNSDNTTNTNWNKNTNSGTANTSNAETNVSTKNRMTALMLCWFLGLFGIHRLYAGKLGTGFLFMYGTAITLLLFGVCAPIAGMFLITMVALVANDFVYIAFGQFKDCYGKLICSDKLQ